MSLSDRDREILKGLEDSLSAEDPKLASIMTQSKPKARRSSSILLGLTLVSVGLVTLLSGLVSKIIPLGILGFLVALVGSTIVLSRFSSSMNSGSIIDASIKDKKNKTGFFQSLEDRWDRRDFDSNN